MNKAPTDRQPTMRVTGIIIFALGLSLLTAVSARVHAEGSQDFGVVLMYQHVSDSKPRSTSVPPEAFEHHLQYLLDNDFNVMPLQDMLASLNNGDALPERAVALTFDGAYASVYEEAFPRLRSIDYPFTVFVSPHHIDRGRPEHMTWEQLRAIADAGNSMGNHTLSHTNLVRIRTDRDTDEWETAVRQEVMAAQARIEERAGNAIRVLAYPYGESDARLEALIADLGFTGMGRHAGAIGSDAPVLSLPRHAIAMGNADLDNFSLRVRSRPLPIDVLSPSDRMLAADADNPVLELRLQSGEPDIDTVNCFASIPGGVDVERDADTGTLRLQANNTLPPGRSTYSCTAPVPGVRGAFYWYSHLWIKPQADGTWPAD